jgi:hypothetical protein
LAVGLEVKDLAGTLEPWVKTFGIIDGGLEMMRFAWPTLEHKLSVQRSRDILPPLGSSEWNPKVVPGTHRYRASLLNKRPVDMLIVEPGTRQLPPTSYQRIPWEDLVSTTCLKKRPRLVLEMWSANAQMWSKGPLCKARATVWSDMEYHTRCRVVRATDIGGTICQDKLVVARVHKSWNHVWSWDPDKAASDTIRAMSNLLTPPGLVPQRSYDMQAKGDPPDARSQPMPSTVGAWIRTEKGIRQVSLEETSRGLGLPKDTCLKITAPLLEQTTSLFHWEYLSASLLTTKKEAASPSPTVASGPRAVNESVQKESQESDNMLRGGQNSCMGSNPVFLPRSGHILDQMYKGGYSAVVNASKFFYQFSTHPDDRPYLGLKHPITGALYAYGGLPMGGNSSPCLAGQYGLSLLRLLRERCKLFQGKGRANCWWTGFLEIGFDPTLGYGFVLESADGPAVKI